MPNRIPKGSLDISHVPPPDPANFWTFRAGQTHTLEDSLPLSFRVDELHDTWVKGTMLLGGRAIERELHLDWPVVLTRDARTLEPDVTLTLRRLEDNTAYLQITGGPRLKQVSRQ